MITTGFIADDGTWIVDGDSAQDLPVGAAVVIVENGAGQRIDRPYGAQVKTELGWAGPEELEDRLETSDEWRRPGIYQVLYPPPSPLRTERPPASSYREYEAGLHAVDR